MNDIYRDMIAITNRHLYQRDYLEQIERIARVKPAAMILREKDLSEEEYETLAVSVKEICDRYEVPLFVHSYINTARKIGCENIHLSVPKLRETLEVAGETRITGFCGVSVSCHSLADVEEAEAAGATQIVLGTIFETQCKPGLTGRGTAFVNEICENCKKPVFAIGGITLENLDDIKAVGAKGGCMMSGFVI